MSDFWQGIELVWERDGIEYRLNLVLLVMFIIAPICDAIGHIAGWW